MKLIVQFELDNEIIEEELELSNDIYDKIIKFAKMNNVSIEECIKVYLQSIAEGITDV